MGTVSVLLVRPVAFAVGSERLDSFWRSTDLTPEILADGDARISAAQFCVAWAEGMRLAGKRTLALDIAAATPAGAFGIVEYVCKSAPTLGDALRQWVRYLNLLDDSVEVGVVVEADRAYLRVLRESEAPAPSSHELCYALVCRYAQELSTRPFRAVAAEFAHPAPPGADAIAAYRAWFGAPVVFGAERTQLVMPAAALEASLVSSDPALLSILTRAADELQKKSASVDPAQVITNQVRRVLHEALRQDDAGVDTVARKLGLTNRSLQRRLEEEGTTFGKLRETVRRELAERYLADGLAISEISFLLGFSEPSAFFRAFKRWTGETPQVWRARPA